MAVGKVRNRVLLFPRDSDAVDRSSLLYTILIGRLYVTKPGFNLLLLVFPVWVDPLVECPIGVYVYHKQKQQNEKKK